MKREIYNKLVEWKHSHARKPLILNGARQVGKTWLLNEFAKNEYSKTTMFSLDRNTQARNIFKTEKSVDKIIRNLSALSGTDITPNDTLLVLDEIQDCPEALTALKYFCEDAPDIHVAVAGSLLGISIHGQTSFPVGKVDQIKVYPMTFTEFLMAVGRERMADVLKQCDWETINALREEYIDLLRQYYYIGGMPAVVSAYVERGQLQEVREIQHRILSDYELDFSKHAPTTEVPRIRMVWNNIPSQLAKENKKFIYGALRQGARASAFETAIQWLVDAGLVYKITHVNTVKMPLKFYEDMNAFKLFCLDVGLMGAMVDAPASAVLINNNVFSEYKGAFSELFVCSQLQGTGIPVHYHTVANSRIELDFVVQIGDQVLPIEVKAEENNQSKSLKTFIAKHDGLIGIRVSMRGHITQDKIECIPLFACREALVNKLSESNNQTLQKQTAKNNHEI